MRLLRFDELRRPIVLAVTIMAVAGFANAHFNNDDDEKSPTPQVSTSHQQLWRTLSSGH
jgi:hypothetical protein